MKASKSPAANSGSCRIEGIDEQKVKNRNLKDAKTGKVLVFGGAGFLGSHLCERLRAQGKIVLCADNFDTGSPGNVEHLRGAGFELLAQDVAVPLAVEVAEEVA
ncbi:MAG: NAD-dependent epimerase/dehydratase family protein, partial [Pseudomonadales bacterium]|nr:NAD-dependent epimerase/dehydratase family protein [Pseudomonadales bacterium]